MHYFSIAQRILFLMLSCMHVFHPLQSFHALHFHALFYILGFLKRESKNEIIFIIFSILLLLIGGQLLNAGHKVMDFNPKI